MPNLFGIDIAGIVNSAITSAGGVLPLTLHKIAHGSRIPTQLTAGPNPTETTYTGRGFIDEYDDSAFDGTNVKRGDRKVVILGASLSDGAVPEFRDLVTIEGTQYSIISVKRDPAAAVYECQARSK